MTRSVWRTLGRDLLRDIALLCVAYVIVVASFGAIAVGSGLPIWLPMLLSVVVFAGAAQFIFIGILATGGNPITAVLACLLVNARLLPLGLAASDALGGGRMRQFFGSHLIVDETVAFALAQPDPDRRRATFWVCGIGLFVSWNIGVLIALATAPFLPVGIPVLLALVGVLASLAGDAAAQRSPEGAP